MTAVTRFPLPDEQAVAVNARRSNDQKIAGEIEMHSVVPTAR